MNPLQQMNLVLSGRRSDLSSTTNIRILGICGSLRKCSANKGLLRAAQQLLPGGVILEIADLSNVPVFNIDLMESESVPESVKRLQRAVENADAILFAVAESNCSLASPLMNAIDWCSMPKSFDEKPAAIMGVGHGGGTACAQNQLRQVAAHLNMHLLNKPEVQIERFEDMDAFDDKGSLQDEKHEERIRVLLSRLLDWTKRLQILGLGARPSLGV